MWVLHVLVCVGEGVTCSVDGGDLRREVPLTLEVLVLGWCVFVFYIVGDFCYLSEIDVDRSFVYAMFTTSFLNVRPLNHISSLFISTIQNLVIQNWNIIQVGLERWPLLWCSLLIWEETIYRRCQG